MKLRVGESWRGRVAGGRVPEVGEVVDLSDLDYGQMKGEAAVAYLRSQYGAGCLVEVKSGRRGPRKRKAD